MEACRLRGTNLGSTENVESVGQPMDILEADFGVRGATDGSAGD